MQLTSKFGNTIHEMILLTPKMSETWTRNGFFFQFRKDMNPCLEDTLFWNADSARWQSGRQSTVRALVCGT